MNVAINKVVHATHEPETVHFCGTTRCGIKFTENRMYADEYALAAEAERDVDCMACVAAGESS